MNFFLNSIYLLFRADVIRQKAEAVRSKANQLIEEHADQTRYTQVSIEEHADYTRYTQVYIEEHADYTSYNQVTIEEHAD